MIESIRLKNFRRHKNLRLSFDKNFNLIHGRNNVGKTTVFLGIEYCLFGMVSGFKKIAQLVHFDAKSMGVEIVFKGRDGNRYKLQRLHKLSSNRKRVASSNFTLKRIDKKKGSAGDEEHYILSSDFGDIEDKLRLKLSELLGISKRLFETTIYFRQGTISQILQGSPKLDIVFGINSATALVDVFGERALLFEKEIKEIDSISIRLEHAKKEKNDYSKQVSERELKAANLKEEVDCQTQYLHTFDGIKTHVKTISSSIQSFENAKTSVEKQTMLFQNVEKELKTLITKSGAKENLLTENAKIKHEIDELKKSVSSVEKKLEKTQLEIRDLEREKGDIEGILKRRKEASMQSKCEYCGAQVDLQKIETEVKDLENLHKNSEESINLKETFIAEQNKLLTKLRSTEKISNERSLTLENQLAQIEDLAKKVENQRKETGRSEGLFLKEREKLLILLSEINKKLLAELEPPKDKKTTAEPLKSTFSSSFVNSISQIAKEMIFSQDDFSIDKVTSVRDKLKELLIAKTTEINTSIQMMKEQLKEITSLIQEYQSKIMSLDKEIASSEQKLQTLQKKKVLSGKYRQLQQVFDKVLTWIRKNSSLALEKQILSYHNTLSVDKEFESVKIDPQNYSISVKPLEVTDNLFYPAMFYQGGGHRLMLGMAYKLALGELIGSPPFLLLDEPTQSVDQVNRVNLLQNMSSVCKNPQIFLITHQDVDQINADNIIEISRETKD